MPPPPAKQELPAPIKKQLWEFYLSTGRGANTLFESLDLDENGYISPTDLQSFVRDVLPADPPDVMPYAWNRLCDRASRGKNYDIRDFKRWLVAATKMSADTE